jgi:transposase
MKRKNVERCSAIQLREKGVSVKEIAKRLKVSVGSVSLWVREVKLTPEQRKVLDKRILENWKKFSENRNLFVKKLRTDKEERTKAFVAEAESEFKNFVAHREFVYGLGLYAGDGSRSERWAVSNMDGHAIAAAARFLKVVGWQLENTVCSVRIQPTCSESRARDFWKSVVPGSNVKVYPYQDKRTEGKLFRGSHKPFGVCKFEAKKSTGLLVKTLRWIEMINTGC